MTTFIARSPNLDRVEGHDRFGIAEAILKGALESELPIDEIVASRRGVLAPLFALAGEDAVERLLIDHGLALVPCADPARQVALAELAAAAGRRGIVLIDAPSLDGAMAALGRLHAAVDRGGGAVLLLVDRPREHGQASPRAALRRFDAPCLEPPDLSGLRDAIEQAARLGRAARRPAGIVLHESLLRTIDTLESRPNRVVPAADLLEAARQRRRRPRPGESLDLMRMVRRLELNGLDGAPSPGERAATALVAVGPARVAVRHVIEELRLAGRLPVLHLGVSHPIDEAVVERLLSRAADVLVLEPSPGAVGVEIAALAARLARRGVACGRVWWDRVPAAPEREPEALGPDDSVNPSTLARKIIHLLHGTRPGLNVAARLAATPPSVAALPPRGSCEPDPISILDEALARLDRWARTRDEAEGPPAAIVVDGQQGSDLPERVLRVERWDRRRFAREGSGAVRQAARERRPRLLAVIDRGGDDAPDPERLARGTAPGERSEPVRIESVPLVDRAGVRDRLRAAVDFDGLTVLVLRTAELDDGAERAAEVDRLGYQPSQRLVWPAELASELRPALPRTVAEAGGLRALVPFDHQTRVDRIVSRRGPLLRVRLRPTLEQIEVLRTRPPTPGARLEQSRLAPPRPVHAGQGAWRCHLAGTRDDPPGIAGEVLLEAGHMMGYHVRSIHDPTPIGPGRAAWTQVLFMRPRPGEPLPTLAAQIPWGEADLLIGVDAIETLRAVDDDPLLRVGAPERMWAVVNAGLLDDQLDRGPQAQPRLVAERLALACDPARLTLDDLASTCRQWFRTDRVVDLVALGVAYQKGMIPVSLEAIAGALRRAESRGAGRAVECFALGRQLAVDGRPMRRIDEPGESAERLLRRIELDRRLGRASERRMLAEVAEIAAALLRRMPGLAETASGREARADAVAAIRRCAAWGGPAYARRYAEAVGRLYDSDRGDLGRELTRLAIRPLAEAMLLRDSIYLATMATSAEHRRRIRQRLGVRVARGDELHRRYLNRFDLRAFGWRIRIDFRTSDWPARMVAFAGRLAPLRRRGSAQERALREYALALVERAATGSATDYRRWATALRRLHDDAVGGRLRGASAEAVRARVEG
ncbi:MAG TPA: hypothetical protein PKC43_09420 [Phycisphaerales bacterium]|nr:hypothetical protein [Phycisphaerales bacterium]HMP37653.1 hypothetical protein [Phycisphaerales bacterium]